MGFDETDMEIEILLANYEPDPEPAFLPIHMYKYVVDYITQDLGPDMKPLWTRKLKLSGSSLFMRFHRIQTVCQIKYKISISVYRMDIGARFVIHRSHEQHEYSSAVFISPTKFHTWYAQFRMERPTSSLPPGASF
jgi:hypothetical protein